MLHIPKVSHIPGITSISRLPLLLTELELMVAVSMMETPPNPCSMSFERARNPSWHLHVERIRPGHETSGQVSTKMAGAVKGNPVCSCSMSAV